MDEKPEAAEAIEPKRKASKKEPAETPAKTGAAAADVAPEAGAQTASEAEPVQPGVNTETKRTLEEWAKLDGAELVKTDDTLTPELLSSLMTKAEYLQSKPGIVRPVKASAPAAPPVHMPTPELWLRMEAAQEERIAKAATYETAKREAREAKAALELADELIAKLYEEHRSGDADDDSPTLYDNVDARGAVATRLPRSEQGMQTTKDGGKISDSAWRDVPLEEIGLPKALCKKYNDALAGLRIPAIATVGDLADATADGRDFTEIASKVNATDSKNTAAALKKFWERLNIDPPLGERVYDVHGSGTWVPTPEPAKVDPFTAAENALDEEIVTRFEFINVSSDVMESETGTLMINTIISTVVDDERKGVPVDDMLKDPRVTPELLGEWKKLAKDLPDETYAATAKAFGHEVKAKTPA